LFPAAANDDIHTPKAKTNNKFWTVDDSKQAYRARLMKAFDKLRERKRRPSIGTKVIRRVLGYAVIIELVHSYDNRAIYSLEYCNGNNNTTVTGFN